MPNPNPKTKLKKGDPRAVEMGRKGGTNKKGSVSIRSALKRAIEDGRINVDDLADSFFLHAKEGNPSYAKLLLEYIDGKVKDELELNGNMQTKIEILPVRPIADKDT